MNCQNNEGKEITMSKQRKTHEIDMCNGPILSKMLLFAIPLMFSSILQLLFNAADIIVVGRFAGDHALAAVGSTSSLINMFVNFFMGLSVGANVLVARFRGAKKGRELKETIHTTITLSLISGIILAIVGFIVAPQILHWMDSPQEVLPLSTIYLRVYFLGMPALMLYNFGAAILRAVGDTKRPLIYLSMAGVLNVSFNLVFVIVFHWSVFGVALATTISQVFSAFLVLRCLMKEEGDIHVELKQLGICKDKLKKIIQIGLPAGLQSVLFSFSNVLIQSSVNSFGATVVAGNAAAANIEGFTYAAMNAFHQSNLSFTSQNFGAGKYKRIDRIFITGLACVSVVGIVLGGFTYLFGPHLLSIYTSADNVIAAGMVRFGFIALPYALFGIMDVMVGSLRGLGYTLAPMIVSLIGTCGLRIIWLETVFRIERFHKIETVYIIYSITWVITAVAHLITYLIVGRKMKKK